MFRFGKFSDFVVCIHTSLGEHPQSESKKSKMFQDVKLIVCHVMLKNFGFLSILGLGDIQSAPLYTSVDSDLTYIQLQCLIIHVRLSLLF